jgi:hypothetical protein
MTTSSKKATKKPLEKIFCETPTPGRKGTWIAKWKYDAVRKAILRSVPRAAAGIPFEDLPESVERALTPEQRKELGSVLWYTVTVKLHMETTGEIERIPGVSPQRLRRLR